MSKLNKLDATIEGKARSKASEEIFPIFENLRKSLENLRIPLNLTSCTVTEANGGTRRTVKWADMVNSMKDEAIKVRTSYWHKKSVDQLLSSVVMEDAGEEKTEETHIVL
jgi:hypothetical protein